MTSHYCHYDVIRYYLLYYATQPLLHAIVHYHYETMITTLLRFVTTLRHILIRLSAIRRHYADSHCRDISASHCHIRHVLLLINAGRFTLIATPLRRIADIIGIDFTPRRLSPRLLPQILPLYCHIHRHMLRALLLLTRCRYVDIVTR